MFSFSSFDDSKNYVFENNDQAQNALGVGSEHSDPSFNELCDQMFESTAEMDMTIIPKAYGSFLLSRLKSQILSIQQSYQPQKLLQSLQILS